MKNLETTQTTKNYFTPLEIINIYNVDNKNERELNKTRKKAKTDRIQVNNFIIDLAQLVIELNPNVEIYGLMPTRSSATLLNRGAVVECLIKALLTKDNKIYFSHCGECDFIGHKGKQYELKLASNYSYASRIINQEHLDVILLTPYGYGIMDETQLTYTSDKHIKPVIHRDARHLKTLDNLLERVYNK